MIAPQFIYLALALAALGGASYLRDTWRGRVAPNRVTWALWGVEGVLAFVVEVQQNVGLASAMTLMLGLAPLAVVAVSFRHHHGVWRIGAFDVVCAVVSLGGLVFWALVNEPTVALVSFVCADQVAALPTLRKSWLKPSTESSRVFFLGSLNCGLTVLTLRHFTSAGVLFPGSIAVTDLVIALSVVTRVGPRLRGELPRGTVFAREETPRSKSPREN